MNRKSSVTSTLDGGVLTIKISGEIDHHTAKSIRENADRDIFFHRVKNTVIDLSEVDFMDSSGLGLILGRYSAIKSLGGTLQIIGASERTVKILKMSGVDKIISINPKTSIKGVKDEK